MTTYTDKILQELFRITKSFSIPLRDIDMEEVLIEPNWPGEIRVNYITKTGYKHYIIMKESSLL